MAASARNAHAEPISPELALIDPDLAVRARSALPIPVPRSGASASSRRAAPPEPELSSASFQAPRITGANQPRPAAPTRPTAVLEQPSSPDRQRRTWRRTFAFLAFAAVAAIAVVTILPSTPRRAARTAARAGPPSQANPATTRAAQQGRRRQTNARPTASPHRPANQRGNKKGGRRTFPTTRVPVARARSFGWPPVTGASFYLVDLYRRTTKLFELRTRQPHFQLPAQWSYGGRVRTLTPGTYRWSVRAVSGTMPNPRARIVVSASLRIAATP